MVYNTKQFTYNPDTRTFATEISDLNGGKNVWSWVPGYTNTGIYLKSHKTGNIARWMIVNRQHDRDNDLLYWDLVPIDCDRDLFAVDDVKMRIYND
jgi:hypothetical protein